MGIAKTEMPICILCMKKMGHTCALSYLKAEHQKAAAELETFLAAREPHDPGDTLINLTIAVEAIKGCIKTREQILGMAGIE